MSAAMIGFVLGGIFCSVPLASIVGSIAYSRGYENGKQKGGK